MEKVMEVQNRLVKKGSKYVVLNNLLKSIDNFVKIFCNILYGVMAFTIFLQVFSRVGGRAFSWTEELARFLMIWGAFIGASSIIRTWENIYVDFLIEKFPTKLKKTICLLIKLVVLTFMIYVTCITLKVLPSVGFFQTTPALGILRFWCHLGMMIGLVLIVVQLFGVVLNDLFKGGKP
jgi:TRAP-type C4-dicarboxylate transport system permease small subunit